MATNRSKNTSTSVQKEEPTELELLRQELENLKKQLLADRVDRVEQLPDVEDRDLSEVKISQDDYIPVMSLLPYSLNLSTREGGQGSIKKFTKFGEVKRIIYKDLIDIMEVHRNFLEAGYFYILHPVLIRHHGLDDVYSKILTKEKIEEIIDSNSDEALSLYNSANEKQQEIIIQLLVEKIKANPDSVNLNMVDRIARVSKVDIIKKAEDEKEYQEMLTQDTE